MTSRYFLEYQSQNHEAMLSLVKGAGLRHPKGDGYLEDGEEVVFSGWVLPEDFTSSVEWVVECQNDAPSIVPLSTKRNDVLEHFSLEQSVAPPFQGFSFSVVADHNVHVSISFSGHKILLWKIKAASDNDRGRSKAGGLFKSMHARSGVGGFPVGRWKFLTLKDCASVSSDFDLLADQDFFALFKHRISDVKAVESLFKELRVPSWSVDFIKNRRFSLPGIFSTVPVYARLSVAVDDFNYVLFVNDSECFYLVQHCTNVCIVFPEVLKIFSLTEVSPWVDRARLKLSDLFYTLSANDFSIADIKGRCQGEFLGVNLSQVRPYHYYYDYLYGLNNLILSESGATYKVYSVKGFDFFDIGKFSSRCDFSSISSDEINIKAIKECGFLIMPCIQYWKTRFDPNLVHLSAKLREVAADTYCGGFSGFDRSEYDFVCWFGVSSEKRSWVEQVEGYAQIVNKLKERFGSICVLVDGRTFPLNPRKVDFSTKEREDKIFNTLVRKCPSVHFKNMIGLRSIEKIYLASQIDCFVSHYATDSIYPSAICKKPGVVFISPSISMMQRDLHVHHNVVEVPPKKVCDVDVGTDAKGWGQTSVSMSWQDVLSCLNKVINRIGL